MLHFLNQFKPYSKNNQSPKFLTKNVKLIGRPDIFGKNNNSIKFELEHDNTRFSAIGFDLINKFEILLSKNKLNVEYSILMYNNRVNLKIYNIN